MTISRYVKTSINYLYLKFFFPFIRLYRYIIGFQPKVIKSNSDITYDFVNLQKNRFLETYKHTEYRSMLYSSNIDKLFYDSNNYKKMISDNTLEIIWKTRILFKNTPYGNAIMFYDVYKNGFAYYSDTNLSYPILNALAMDYVIKFYCRDFFLDEITLPEGYKSMKILDCIVKSEEIESKKDREKDIENGETEDYKTIYKRMYADGTKLPFAKFKKYSNVVTKENETKETKIYNTNKFIYLGKIRNFTFLQQNEKKPKTELSGNTIPYSEYKKQILANI